MTSVPSSSILIFIFICFDVILSVHPIILVPMIVIVTSGLDYKLPQFDDHILHTCLVNKSL